MKKIFFVAIMLGAAYTLFAQDPTVEKVKVKEDKTKVKFSDDTKIKYETTSVPMEIKTHFESTHPGITVVSWEPMTDYWYVTYKSDNNRMIHVYYNTQIWYMYDLTRNGNFIEALPVLNTFVPEVVVTSAIDKYGNNLYSITALKPVTAATEGNYVITVIKNGISDRVMMNGEGVVMNTRQM